MSSALSIKAELLNRDGSCRDINFSEWISRSDAAGLVEFLATRWNFVNAYDGQGKSYSMSQALALMAAEAGSLHMLWANDTLLPHVQLYVLWPAPSRFFCEITFFPEELEVTRFDLQEFFALLAALVSAARSSEYYVRYENVSWEHGDVGANSGVIFSHHDRVLTQA